MTKRSKFNKYSRRVAAAGRPLSKLEAHLALTFGSRRRTLTPPTGKRHQYRVDRAAALVPTKAKRSGKVKR